MPLMSIHVHYFQIATFSETKLLYVVALTTFAAALLGVLVWFPSKVHNRNAPPGPRSSFFLGRFNLSAGRIPLDKAMEWFEKYGPIVSLKQGSVDVVMVSDYELIKELFWKPQLHYRPTTWGQSSREKGEMRNEEASHLCDFLASKQGCPVSSFSITHKCHINTMCRFLLGYRFDFDDPRFAPLQTALSGFRLQSAAAPVEHRAAWLRRIIVDRLWPSSVSASRHRLLTSLNTAVRVGEDVNFKTYTLLKDTVVVPNLMAVHRSRKLWKDPDTFNPSRFLRADGKTQTTRPEGLLTFSVGGDGTNAMWFVFVVMCVMFVVILFLAVFVFTEPELSEDEIEGDSGGGSGGQGTASGGSGSTLYKRDTASRVLMFDEMSVRKSLHIRESDMALLGKVDFAEHTKPSDQVKDGDHVLVFLFRPFLGGWSQTVGAFCTSGAAPGSVVAKLLLQCIVLLSNAGVVVDAVTCDNSTSNRSALNSLGFSGDINKVSTSFEHPVDPSEVIQVIIDPPHIFKCIRNNLLKAGKFLVEVHHSHYAALLDYEEQQAGLRAVPKLTKAHIRPNAFQKLSVRLAVQARNDNCSSTESTASAMDFYRSREECDELHDSKATSDFTKRLNGLFECLNSKRPEDVQYNEAQHIDTLKQNIEWLDRWQSYIQSLPKQKQFFFLSKPMCNALRMTLHSIVTLVQKLLKSGFRYVLVGNFGQDHLERFFGITRHVAGAGGQPTVQQFLFIYRLLSVNNLIRPPQRASVQGDGPRLLLKMQDLFKHKEPTSNQIDTLAILLDDKLLDPTECTQEVSSPESTKDCILDYLGGYVATKLAKISCKDCLKNTQELLPRAKCTDGN
ncbi:hypothetical protein HPB50_023810 [Hyalomma asiaticum]|uniref:Uncharacterized protein n=1 Tax=Hyalomma asiaticum TaxID=266040 RepID=A0ACB7SPT4_HYAAI|nr:hypothetical protein HPB50_023810 [Hyalomma asiaticum]